MPLLVLAAQEPELGLRRVAASALADIAKHLPELAQAVVDAGLHISYVCLRCLSADSRWKLGQCCSLTCCSALCSASPIVHCIEICTTAAQHFH